MTDERKDELAGKADDPGNAEDKATAPAAAAAAPERLETRYLVYETPDMGRTLNLVGDQLAGSSSQAINRKVGPLAPGDERVFTAVSENHLKLRIPPPRIG